MNKILNIQDVHINPSRIEEGQRHIDRICEVAKAEKVTAICSAGDFFDRALQANDKSSFDIILKMAMQLQAAAPVYYITGTPSHDAVGCYAAFKAIGWKEINIGQSEVIGDVLIMGIPEITPALIVAKYPDMKKSEVIEKQYELINYEIEHYYAPLAAAHPGPVHLMIHSHVAGAKFREDQKPRESEFMHTLAMLKRIGADFIQAGHLHLEQDFDGGRYGGPAHISWSDVNFKNGFDVIKYFGGYKLNIDRFEFADLERKKYIIKDVLDIKALESQIKPNTNVWIEIHCNKEFADQFDKKTSLAELKEKVSIGDLSKITTEIQFEEHNRIDTEEYEKCRTLEDLFKLSLPEAPKTMLLKVNEADQAVESEKAAEVKYNFGFPEVTITGSKAGRENGVDVIHVNPELFQSGANGLTGANGTGKSFSLGFATPFSMHLPTGIDLKALFELKASSIIRKFPIDGGIITQRIDIDPTLAAPSAKYYMDINGESVMGNTTNKEPFDSAVYEIFGTVQMFMACAFKGQKENPKFPSLENAKESDLREIFTALLGTDRKPLKVFAHAKCVSLKETIKIDAGKIETLESLLENRKELKSETEAKINDKAENYKLLIESNGKLTTASEAAGSYENTYRQNKVIEDQVKVLEKEKTGLVSSNWSNGAEIEKLKIVLENIDSTREDLKKEKEFQGSYNTISDNYIVMNKKYNDSVVAWNDEIKEIDKVLESIQKEAELLKLNMSVKEKAISGFDIDIKTYKMTIEHQNKPCEHCLKLPSESQTIIDKAVIGLFEAEESQAYLMDEKIDRGIKLEELTASYRSIRSTKTPQPEKSESLTASETAMEDLKKKFSVEKIFDLEATINSLKASEEKKRDLGKKVTAAEKRIKEIDSAIETLNKAIVPVDLDAYNANNNLKDDLTDSIREINIKIGSLTAQIEGLEKRIEKSVEQSKKIKEIKERSNVNQFDLTEWDIIEAQFSPKGIPAMELSLLAPIVDREANSLLQTYGTRYRIETITQDLVKKNMVEKFKILVHDSVASEPKNLPVISGGQGVWVTTATQEAIAKVASQRSGRNYLFAIKDETDAALDQETMPIYYKMMDLAMNSKRVLISVTHSPEGKAALPNIVEITEFFVGYRE